MSLQLEFNKAADQVKNLKTKPSDDDLLALYGLFKQASFGDIDSDRLVMFNNFKKDDKMKAWSKNKGMNKEKAMKEYVKIIKSLCQKYGLLK